MLHYYDQMGLLKPTSYGANGYRQYVEDLSAFFTRATERYCANKVAEG